MGGSSANPHDYIPQPNNELALAQMGMQSQLGQNALLNQNKMLELVSALPQQAYTPDVYSPVGQLAQANKVAAVNAFNSKKLEQEQNPSAAAARESLNTAAQQGLDQNYWQNTMNTYGKKIGVM
jgi:hypothetical protein